MSEKVKLGQVVIPNAQKKWFRYVQSDGQVFAVKPSREPLSEEEKSKRKAVKQKERGKVLAKRAAIRQALKIAKKKARRTLEPKDAEAVVSLMAEYEAEMGRKA